MKIYHHNDMDGVTSEFLVTRNLQSKRREFIESFAVNYEADVPDKFDRAQEREEVWIVDYSFTESTLPILQKLIDKECKIIWIDHHDSSISLEQSHPELKSISGIRSKSMSGAGLVYIYMHFSDYTNIESLKSECPDYIQLVSDYDTFTNKLNPGTERFKLAYDAAQDKFKFLDDISGDPQSLISILMKGKIIKEYIDSDNIFYRNENGYESEFEGLKVFVINKDTNSWIFGDLYNKYPMVCLFVFNGELYTYSLYSSDPKVDCSKIAEKYGGGGHKGAAGFTSKELLLKKK